MPNGVSGPFGDHVTELAPVELPPQAPPRTERLEPGQLIFALIAHDVGTFGRRYASQLNAEQSSRTQHVEPPRA